MDELIKSFSSKYYIEQVLNMLCYRGWLDEESKATTLATYDEQNIFKFSIKPQHIKGTDITQCCVVLYLVNDAIDNIDKAIQNPNDVRTIFIIDDRLSFSKFKDYDKPKKSEYYTLEMHRASEFMFDITSHCWVPKYEIETSTSIFEHGASLDSRNIMTVAHSDPMVRYIGGRIGDIVKITTNDAIKYRRVIYKILS